MLPDVERLRPLVLVLGQLLKVHQRIAVVSVEAEHLLERLEGTIDEAAVPEVEAETQLHVRARFEFREIWALEKRLMDVDGVADLSLPSVQVARGSSGFRARRCDTGRLREFLDRLVDLVVREEVEPSI